MNDCDYLIILLNDICINIRIKSLKRKIQKNIRNNKLIIIWILFIKKIIVNKNNFIEKNRLRDR